MTSSSQNLAFSLLRQLGNSALHLLYPPLCLHCREELGTDCPLFCRTCLKFLEMIDPSTRCLYCFTSEIKTGIAVCCAECRKNSQVIHRTAAVFDYEGPAATLIKQLKYGGQPYLAEGAGAFLTTQLLRLNWPLPDFIVPMPMAPLRQLNRGYNQSQLLAEVVGRLINRPVLDILKRTSGDFSQAGLSHEQRLQLSEQAFTIKSVNNQVREKCLLLIDDVMTTGSSLRRCAETLQSAFPESLYALTLCRAI